MVMAIGLCILLFFVYVVRRRSVTSVTEPEIETLTEQTFDKTPSSSDYDTGKAVKNAESLIEFLRIKSEKPRIKKEMFNLNNVLNELAGSLAVQCKGSDLELVFDIEKDVPKYLLGDPLQLGNILFNLSKNMITQEKQPEILIKVRRSSSAAHDTEIRFEVSNRELAFSATEKKILLEPEDEALSSEERGIGFYIAKVLISLMQGRVALHYDAENGTVVTVTLPFEIYKRNELRKYRLPSKSLTEKKVFLVESSTVSAEAIKKMLQYFKYRVVMVSAKHLQKQIPNLSRYDIAIFDEKVFNAALQTYIKELREEKDIKVVLLSSVFSEEVHTWPKSIVDVVAKKPFSQERIFEVILDLYGEADTCSEVPMDKALKRDEKRLVHRDLFEDRAEVSMESFSDFSGTSVLIVEDNRINQKILTNVLGRSGIALDVACNGQEAVDMTIGAGKTYDLVLMDINMPVMDGYSATAILREDPLYETIPIVALSALIMESEVEKMFAKGVSGYLSKPLRVGQLYAAFEFFLGKHTPTEVAEKCTHTAAPKLHGLNTTLGIANSNGSMITYVGILNEFISAYGQSDSTMRSLIDDRKYLQTKILCNDMRQLTKIIGAKKMYDVVDTMYKLFLYENEEMLPKYVESYRRELENLRHSIEKYLKGVEV